MGNKKSSNPCDLNGIEEWMNQFLRDPFTNFLDEYTFRVDLFETSSSYIVEAYLTKQPIQKIVLELNNNTVTISVSYEGDQNPKERTIELPFFIENKHIEVQNNQSILEIIVYKEGIEERSSKIIALEI